MRFGAIAVRYAAGVSVVIEVLRTDRRLEVDRHPHPKRRRGDDDQHLLAVAKNERFAHDVAQLRQRLFDDAGGVERGHEFERAAVQGRHFRAVDRDERVADSAPAQRGEHMLDRRHAMLAQADDGRATGVDHVVRVRGKLDGVVEPKAQPAARRCGEYANAGGPAGV